MPLNPHSSSVGIRNALALPLTALSDRLARLESLLSRIAPVPAEWVKGVTPGSRKRKKGDDLEAIPCTSWDTLVGAWKKAMEWTDGLDVTLSVMLASVLSTEALGEPIWLIIIGPPSTGKTTLAEGLGVAQGHIVCLDVLTGLCTGAMPLKDAPREDISLVERIRGKTLIIKDGDTLLKAPNRSQILAELRALYDGAIRTHYRNGRRPSHDNHKVTVHFCGTPSLHELDAAELGARFLHVYVMDGIDAELERAVNRSVMLRAFSNISVIANGKPETRLDPKMALAKGLTGGFVNHLRSNAEAILSLRGGISSHDATTIMNYGEFISFMRARPGKEQDEEVYREFSSRLVEQLARLAACLAGVLGKDQVGTEVMRRVRKVALDTARGTTLKIAQYLYGANRVGMESGTLQYLLCKKDEKVSPLLSFLREIGAVEWIPGGAGKGLRVSPRWRLTERLQGLCESIWGKNDDDAPE